MANENFSIKDIISEQVKNNVDANITNNNPKADDNVQLVRYKGGETVKDRKGEEYKNLNSNNPFNLKFDKEKGKFVLGTLKAKKGEPLKAKKGEPETGNEWASDAAQKIWDSGKSMDEVETEMNKQWPLASAIIKDNDNAAWKAESSGSDENIQYYDKKEGTDITDGEKYIHYRSPREQAEIVLAKRYGFDLDYNEPIIKETSTRPSVAIGLLHKTGLKKDWENLINYNVGPKEFYKNYKELKTKLLGLDTLKSEKELKKLGFTSQEDFDTANNYLISSLDKNANNYLKYLKYLKKDNKPETKEETVPTEAETKAETVPANKYLISSLDKKAASIANKYLKKDNNPETKEETVPTKAETKAETVPATKAETVPTEAETEAETVPAKEEDNATFSLEEARLNAEVTAQEKRAQEEAEIIANKELTRKEAKDLDKELEDAAKKKQQDLFAYEDWLKNPSIISGVFGNSGLSTAKRWGLGLATLFAIFSDVAANYGKGINNNTDFKTAAMDQLNSTIKTIQNKRAEEIGEMASRPYKTTAENEEKLNKDFEKLRRSYVAKLFIPVEATRNFIQASQINKDEPLPESLYREFADEARDGYINELVKKNKKLRNAYLNEDGTLNADGERAFLEKLDIAIGDYRRILGLSDERLSNINNLLDMDKKRAEVRSKVHDVVFQTNKDYIDAINAMESENRTLEESKLGFTEAKTLEAMLDLAQKNRNAISGLATSSANTTEGTSDTETSINRFSEQGGLEKVNEELKKHGWKVELNGKVGAKLPLKVVSIGVTGGGDWTNERANRFAQTEYEKWTREDERNLTKARKLSAASGKNIDEAYDEIMSFLNSEKAKGAEADFNKVRQNILDVIDNKIQYNKQVIDELKEMRAKESKFDTGENNSASTKNPYVSIYNDIPTKDANWYRHRLAMS